MKIGLSGLCILGVLCLVGCQGKDTAGESGADVASSATGKKKYREESLQNHNGYWVLCYFEGNEKAPPQNERTADWMHEHSCQPEGGFGLAPDGERSKDGL